MSETTRPPRSGGKRTKKTSKKGADSKKPSEHEQPDPIQEEELPSDPDHSAPDAKGASAGTKSSAPPAAAAAVAPPPAAAIIDPDGSPQTLPSTMAAPPPVSLVTALAPPSTGPPAPVEEQSGREIVMTKLTDLFRVTVETFQSEVATGARHPSDILKRVSDDLNELTPYFESLTKLSNVIDAFFSHDSEATGTAMETLVQTTRYHDFLYPILKELCKVLLPTGSTRSKRAGGSTSAGRQIPSYREPRPPTKPVNLFEEDDEKEPVMPPPSSSHKRKAPAASASTPIEEPTDDWGSPSEIPRHEPPRAGRKPIDRGSRANPLDRDDGNDQSMWGDESSGINGHGASRPGTAERGKKTSQLSSSGAGRPVKVDVPKINGGRTAVKPVRIPHDYKVKVESAGGFTRQLNEKD